VSLDITHAYSDRHHNPGEFVDWFEVDGIHSETGRQFDHDLFGLVEHGASRWVVDISGHSASSQDQEILMPMLQSVRSS
jgi:hypothetical protein